jgi:hypothetical protein
MYLSDLECPAIGGSYTAYSYTACVSASPIACQRRPLQHKQMRVILGPTSSRSADPAGRFINLTCTDLPVVTMPDSAVTQKVALLAPPLDAVHAVYTLPRALLPAPFTNARTNNLTFYAPQLNCTCTWHRRLRLVQYDCT